MTFSCFKLFSVWKDYSSSLVNKVKMHWGRPEWQFQILHKSRRYFKGNLIELFPSHSNENLWGTATCKINMEMPCWTEVPYFFSRLSWSLGLICESPRAWFENCWAIQPLLDVGTHPSTWMHEYAMFWKSLCWHISWGLLCERLSPCLIKLLPVVFLVCKTFVYFIKKPFMPERIQVV